MFLCNFYSIQDDVCEVLNKDFLGGLLEFVDFVGLDFELY
jgi:hypothetical protein